MGINFSQISTNYYVAGDEDDLDVDGGEGFEVYTWAGQTRVREGTT